MALGKLSIVIGAGLLGSVLAKDSLMPSFSDVLKGAYKIVLKPISQGDSGSTAGKPKNDALMAQLNTIRQDLENMTSNRPITIVTTNAGGRRHGLIILIVAAGTVYIWWKGWIPDLNFATRRSLSDACNSVAKQLDQVYTSIRATRRELSSRMNNTDSSLSELMEEQNATQDEVSHLRREVDSIGGSTQTILQAVETVESRIEPLQLTADTLCLKVIGLVRAARNMENQVIPGAIQGSSNSSKALEPPPISSSARSISLPPALTLEEPSPTASSASNEHQTLRRSPSPTSGLKDFEGISALTVDSSSPRISNGTQLSSESNGSATTGGIFGRIVTGSFLSRTRSAIQGFK